MVKKEKNPIEDESKETKSKPNTLMIARERDIAADFATKVYQKFDQLIKSIVLFGSSAKNSSSTKSDIDIIIIIDDVSMKWDQELIAWYREELGKIVRENPYRKPLHINSVKLSTWWADLMRGDPIVLNVLRYGDALIDHGGFFNPLRVLLKEGKIKSTPEAIYTLLQRAPGHMTRSRQAILSAIDGLYWSMVDSAHAALIASGVSPASPERVPEDLEERFVKTKILNKSFVRDYIEVHNAAKRIIHGDLTHIEGKQIDTWFVKADKFLGEMAKIVDDIVKRKK